jgi:serine phosphatase RsbU (regulator of sigma subunit)
MTDLGNLVGIDSVLDQEGQIKWDEEKTKQAISYNRIGLWIALILYPVWSLLDYFLAPHSQYHLFLNLRFLCAGIMLVFAVLHLKWKFNPDWLAYPVVLTIGTDIAYKCNVVSHEILTPYMIQYCTLFVCSGMLHIWRTRNSLLVVAITLTSFIAFREMFQKHTYPEVLSNGGLIIITVFIVYVFLIKTRVMLMKKAFTARYRLSIALDEVKDKNTIIEKKNLQIVDSINYGKRIQHAFLPETKELQCAFGEHLLMYRPKNVVSGDFYWFAETEQKKYFAVVDCTGHGVPGAFMSIIGASLLNQLVREKKLTEPNDILDHMREHLRVLLKQDSNDVRDGMEIGLISIDKTSKALHYAGARIMLFIVNNNEIQDIEPDKQPIGGIDYKGFTKYTNHIITLQEKSVLFMTSDGYPDQFNDENKKYGKKKTKELFLEIAKKNPKDGCHFINTTFDEWRGRQDQIDDVLVAGFWID